VKEGGSTTGVITSNPTIPLVFFCFLIHTPDIGLVPYFCTFLSLAIYHRDFSPEPISLLLDRMTGRISKPKFKTGNVVTL
jgi:hypothetical protein